MANEEQLAILHQGVEAWNTWREKNPFEEIDLSGADLSWALLSGVNFHGANLRNANIINAELGQSNLAGADLREAYLCGAYLRGSTLIRTNFSGAYLNEADLRETFLKKADFNNADLSGACLNYANLVDVNFEESNLTNCYIHGISAWKLNLKNSIQRGLIITDFDESKVTVDNLEVAQFIYLLLHNEKIRDVIDSITSKVVLILGRFTPKRKPVLDAIKEELRKRDYLPVLFDFKGPGSRDLTETISTLAHMARFVIADITDAKSIPAELQCIVPQLPSVPVQPLILDSDYDYALFKHIMGFKSVLELYRYENQTELIAALGERVIAPAEAKVNEIRAR